MALKVALPSRHYKQIVCSDALEMLKEAGFQLVCNDTGRKLDREEQKELISGAYAIITGTEVYDADMLSVCKECKVICRLGVGVENYDLQTMKEMGIQVGIISNNNAVAEFALMLILASLKNLSALDHDVRRGMWSRYTMTELCGKTVGLVGFGRIARRLSELLKGFDVTILAYSPSLKQETAEKYGVKCVSFEELMKESDVISVHSPLTKDTYHLINEETFKLMKDGVYLINTSRGPVIDEKALLENIENGKIAGIASDVFEVEPVKDNDPILQVKNGVFSPHCAALTNETNYNAGIICAQSIINVLNGGKPVNPVI